MADKRLNDLSIAPDGAYIYAEDASGNQIKIAKADLATVVAGQLKYNKPISVEPNSATFFRVCNLRYDNEAFNGCIEVIISRSEGRNPTLVHIGVCASRKTEGLIHVNASLTLSGSETSGIVYRDSDYLYIKIKAYYLGHLSYKSFRGVCEMTPASVTESDLTLVL